MSNAISQPGARVLPKEKLECIMIWWEKSILPLSGKILSGQKLQSLQKGVFGKTKLTPRKSVIVL